MSRFFNTIHYQIRRLIGDFDVFISIVVVMIVYHVLFSNVYTEVSNNNTRRDVYANINLQRIGMPDSVGYTSEITRHHANETCGILIVPWKLPADKAWVYIATIIPGALAFVLLFVAIQFTEFVIVFTFTIKHLNAFSE